MIRGPDAIRLRTMSRFMRAGVALLAAMLLPSCINRGLSVEASSLAEACLGASIGSRSSATVTNVSTTPTVGEVRVRWMLSSDSVPSTDDLALLGSGVEVTIGSLDADESYPITSPNLIVPSTARLGPQYLILVAVDLGDTDLGIAYDAVPITINQCPTAGACDTSYGSDAAYRASPHTSRGAFGTNGDRPVFVADKSTLADRGLMIGGREGARGLLLRYNANRTFAWGKSLSRCYGDTVGSIAIFNDGTLAVTTSYYTGTHQESALSAFSRTGRLLWQRVVESRPNACTTCPGPSLHAIVATDASDDTAVVAVSDGYEGIVRLARIDRYGNEIQRRTYTNAELQLGPSGGPADIATYRNAGTPSDVLLGFPEGAVLLDAGLGLRWGRPLSDMLGAYPYSGVEVEICTPQDLYIATTGVEYFNGQDVISSYDTAGNVRWRVDIREARSYGTAPAYTEPLGLLRPRRFALRCNEQDLPELTFIRTADGRSFERDIRGLTLLHSGAVHRKYQGVFPTTGSFAGATGIDESILDFLSLQSGKFSLLSRSTLGWTRY
jgi:hypothetical protein